ncbi:MAG: hypothetical protein L0L69_01155 [Propionibacterium sp.]|nr:hypothetical protein [Actinomyces sp.]MDN6793669.1 hypothetical protein [Propionibacterium sp.]
MENPYLSETVPWATYGVAAVVSTHTRWATEDRAYTVTMGVVVTCLVAVSVVAYVRHRSRWPQVATSPVWAGVYAVVFALAATTGPSTHVQLMIAVATCTLIAGRVSQVAQVLSSQGDDAEKQG